MNEVVIITTLGDRINAKVTDSELKTFEVHGIKYELIGKTEKPDVLKKPSEKTE